MSNKPRKKKIKVKGQKKKKILVGKNPAVEMEAYIRSVVINMTSALEAKVDDLIKEVGNIKANMIASQTCLEKAGVIKEEDFMKEYERYVIQELGAIESGMMTGIAIFSLYNVDKFKVSS